MQIHFSPFLFIVSLAFSISQTVYATFQLFLLIKKEEGKRTINYLQKTVLFLLFLSLLFFNAQNFLGVFLSYTQRSVKYRAVNPNAYEKIFQFSDIIFDSLQRSVTLLSTIMFQPIFAKISSKPQKNLSHFNHFIFIFSFSQIFLYPFLFFIFKNKPDVALFITDIFNIAEESFIFLMLCFILGNFINILKTKNISSQYKKIIFEAEISELKIILITLFTQVFINFIYKCMVFTIGLINQNILGNILLDYSYLFRLISTSLQLFSVFKLCFVEISFDVLPEDNKLKKPIEKLEKDKLGPKNMLYFTQPNES